MSLQVVLSKNGGFSVKELLSIIAQFRVTFNQEVEVEMKKQATFIRMFSPLFSAEYKKAILYFTLGEGLSIAPSTELTSASRKMELAKFAKMASKLLGKSAFDFKLHCEDRKKGSSLELHFERLEGERVQQIFVESDNASLEKIFTRLIEKIAQEQEGTIFTTNPGAFLEASRSLQKKSDAQFEACA